MPVEYRHNHYVPEWYQKRFLPPGQKTQALYYLDRSPKFFGTQGRPTSRPWPQVLGLHGLFCSRRAAVGTVLAGHGLAA